MEECGQKKIKSGKFDLIAMLRYMHCNNNRRAYQNAATTLHVGNTENNENKENDENGLEIFKEDLISILFHPTLSYAR